MPVSAQITDRPIEVDALLREAKSSSTGAVLLFLGTVRDHNQGRPVRGMHYEAYETMAQGVLREILEQAASETEVDALVAVHRVGELAIGDVSVAIAVGSRHRDEAYRASRAVIEEVKRRLPVWKKEFYTDGRGEWLDGTDPRMPVTAFEAPGDAAARRRMGS